MSNKQLGFWAVFSIATGTQIGSSVFISPITLAPYGYYSLIGWIISGTGAIALSLVFAQLCSAMPRTGGPHVYVEKALGKKAAFFTGWTYWVISWVSTTAVVITIVGYLAPLLQLEGKISYLLLELSILIFFTFLNLKGLALIGKVEILLTILKFVPLLIISIFAFRYFDINNLLEVHHDFKNLEPMNILGQTTLLTLWGFIGLETATTSAGSVVNASKNIPRAIVCGTIAVASIYLLSSTAIMGLIPPTELANSQAPYSDAIKLLFGGNWYIAMSLLAAVICVGSLNAWILTSGQILLGLSNDGFVPSKLKECNKNGSPAFAIILGSSGIAPLLLLVMNDNLSNQIKDIIDISVTAFLFIYLICCVSFFKLIFQNLISKKYAAAGLVSAVFCLWVLYETNLYTIVSAALFIFSALPLYLLWYRKSQRIVE